MIPTMSDSEPVPADFLPSKVAPSMNQPLSQFGRGWKGSSMNEHNACLDPMRVERCSVWQYSDQEAFEYKWIVSEKAGCDQGEEALKQWVKQHWWGFLRARWIEHLHGARFWIELDKDDFGLVFREFPEQRHLLSDIVAQIKNGKENLDIIEWAEKNNIPTEPVHDILERLDINGHRLIHYFDTL